MTNQFYGLYRGIVEDTEDPYDRKRLQIIVPELLDDVGMWAEPCIPPGWKLIPEVGDVVWVMFEGGDISRAVWIGTHSGKGVRPKPV